MTEITNCISGYSKELGSRLKHLRQSRGLTQEDLAVATYTTTTTISRYERGEREPDFGTMLNLAEVLDVDLNFLLGCTKKALTADEIAIITKYRALDDRGKSAVLQALEHEYSFVRRE